MIIAANSLMLLHLQMRLLTQKKMEGTGYMSLFKSCQIVLDSNCLIHKIMSCLRRDDVTHHPLQSSFFNFVKHKYL